MVVKLFCLGIWIFKNYIIFFKYLSREGQNLKHIFQAQNLLAGLFYVQESFSLFQDQNYVFRMFYFRFKEEK